MICRGAFREPLIKYDFFDKLRDGEYPSLFVDMHMKNKPFTLCVNWSEDGQWPSLQIIRTQGNSIYFFVVRHSY